MSKPRLSFWQIWNMSFGFLGIQFGWGLQLANMSGIYTYLGAEPDKIPYLWLAGPVTGLLVQPIIGSMSDRTWNRLGRRRPYFLVGAIVASIALFFMPNSSALWMAAGLLWILDASINVSMEPFRAFVADKLNPEQRTTGFVMQSFFIGVGATMANVLPYIFNKYGTDEAYRHQIDAANATGAASPHLIPPSVVYSFKIGAVAFLLAVLWTVFTSKEYPPENMQEFERKKREHRGIAAGFAEISSAIREMPQTMKQLAVVQIFTWLGLFCMWMFFGLTTSYHIFGATSDKDPLFVQGQAWGGISFAVYSIVCFVSGLRASQNRQRHKPQDCSCNLAHMRRHRLAFGLLYSQPVCAVADDGGRRHCVGFYSLDALRDTCWLAARRANGRLHGSVQFLHRHP